MFEAICRMLTKCDSDVTVFPPTELYNEGWLLRLILDFLDRNRQFDHRLALVNDARWYSEALMHSRFLKRYNGDPQAELFTHADGIVGQFNIAIRGQSDVGLLNKTRQFIVIEAKLRSKLSAGITNVPGYDQAARTVACMAYLIGRSHIEVSQIDSLAFYVIAPKQKIEMGVFDNLVTKESIRNKVKIRVEAYEGRHDEWFHNTFLPVLNRIKLEIISWEKIIQDLPQNSETMSIQEFYQKCLNFNSLQTGKMSKATKYFSNGITK